MTRNKINKVRFGLIFCLLAFYSLAVSSAVAGAPLQVIKIASEGGSAVVRKKGRLKVFHTGDRLPPYGKITAIVDGRIVLSDNNGQTFLIDIQDGKQSIKRISKVNTKSAASKLISIESGGIVGNGKGKDNGAMKKTKEIKATDK